MTATVEPIVEPKVVLIAGSGIKIYWCHVKDQQMVEQVCKGIYFRRSSRVCRFCLGVKKNDEWPEPWASITKKGQKVENNEG